MLFSTEYLMRLFPQYKGRPQQLIPIEEVTTDSRKKTKKSLFVPIKGENFDGHEFLREAFENGTVATIWEKDKQLPEFLPADFPVFFVDDTLSALQKLAHQYRLDVNPVVIGVTGSNGKTTTKDLIGTVASSQFRTHRTKGNLNNHIGLPLTVLSMPKGTEVLVLEMGMSNFGEIELLSKLALPDYAVITNIGESHIEYLGSREGIAQAKTEIMAGLKSKGQLIIDGDEPLLSPLKNKAEVISCGFNKSNQMLISEVEMHDGYTDFVLNNQRKFQLKMLGKHNVKNAVYAITIGEKLEISPDKVKAALLDLQLTGMRFELINGLEGSTIINDAYNASPTSMKASIQVIKEMNPYRTKVLVLGDIYELGSQSKVFHRDIAEVITEDIDAVFTLGEDADEISSAVSATNKGVRAKHFSSREELVKELKPYLHKESLVLLKASRGMKLENLLTEIAD